MADNIGTTRPKRGSVQQPINRDTRQQTEQKQSGETPKVTSTSDTRRPRPTAGEPGTKPRPKFENLNPRVSKLELSDEQIREMIDLLYKVVASSKTRSADTREAIKNLEDKYPEFKKGALKLTNIKERLDKADLNADDITRRLGILEQYMTSDKKEVRGYAKIEYDKLVSEFKVNVGGEVLSVADGFNAVVRRIENLEDDVSTLKSTAGIFGESFEAHAEMLNDHSDELNARHEGDANQGRNLLVAFGASVLVGIIAFFIKLGMQIPDKVKNETIDSTAVKHVQDYANTNGIGFALLVGLLAFFATLVITIAIVVVISRRSGSSRVGYIHHTKINDESITAFDRRIEAKIAADKAEQDKANQKEVDARRAAKETEAREADVATDPELRRMRDELEAPTPANSATVGAGHGSH